MKLSDIEIGGRAVIVKVAGHGGFRRRIVEMGFIKGKVVEVLNRAPLGDPIEYAVMGYNVSLRLSEAEKIEVITVAEAEEVVRRKSMVNGQQSTVEPLRPSDTSPKTGEELAVRLPRGGSDSND